MSKIKYLLSSKAFKKKPVAVIFRSLILLLSMIFKLKLKYSVDFKHNKFIYTFKPYVRSGLGGRGQYLFRELYDPFFSVGDQIFYKKFNFIDVGCSRGFFAMYLLGLKKLNSRGLCIEPLSKAVYDFKEILKLNDIKRAKIINGVVSNKSTQNTSLYRVNDKHGYYSLIKNVRFADEKILKKINTKSFTIDQLIFKKKYLKSVEFIKIDAEGAEYEILCKSLKTIRKFKPVIHCEVTRKKSDIFNLLKNNNYNLFTISYDNISPLKIKDFRGDLLAINKNTNYIKKLNKN
tara:strand:+ start:527 stop:1396 length:870 start_codon:yes stop_codon:yes gene_type:complete